MPAGQDTLVFIHGSGDSAQVWESLIGLLPAFHSIALDLPGHGALIDAPLVAVSVGGYAEFVSAELERRDISTPTVIGHSLGGAVALRLALDAPSQVGRIALVGSGARLRVAPAFLDIARNAGSHGDPIFTRAGFAEEHVTQADTFHAARMPTAPGMLHADLAACDQFDVMGELERITQPSLIIVGAEDRMTPVKFAQFLHTKLHDSALVVIPASGHYAQVEQPRLVADALRAWLA